MNKPLFSTGNLKNLPGVRLQNFTARTSFAKVCTDTRAIEKGCLFLAIKGERFDGHTFIREAIRKGAAAVAVDAKALPGLKGINNIPLLVAQDTVALLGQLAHLRRRQMNAKVVSITGSNGKTGTKEMLRSLLKEKYRVHATEANNNNTIGVPLTILQAPAGTEVIVLEHGTNHFGEIEYSAAVAAPDIALITNIGASHLEYLKSQKNVLKEKKALLDVTEEGGGTVLINADDKHLRPLARKYTNVITFGTGASADVSCKVRRFSRTGFPNVRIEGFEKTIDFSLPLFGKQNAWNLGAAATAGLCLGISHQDILHAVKKLTPPKHRLAPIHLHNGLLIDDTYNANPQSMAAAFDVLRNIKHYEYRWVILGDMFELGKDSEKFHRALAQNLMKIRKIRVITHGAFMKSLYMELKKYYVPVWYCETRQQLAQMIGDSDFSHAVTLVKGSRGMKMEEFVTQIAEKNQ